MSKLKAIGVGSAFSLKNFQSNFILESNSGKRMLIDCGSFAPFALEEVGLSAFDIDAVYISHLHADHIGGLEWLGFLKYFTPSEKKPKLFISKYLVDKLWNNSLSGGMSTLQGQINHLEDFFDVYSFDNNEQFTWEEIEFQPVQVVHIMNGFGLEPAYGLMFPLNEHRVLWTSDTQHKPEQLADMYNLVDVIFHDCEVIYGANKVPIKSRVHAHYDDLKTLPDDVKAKMYLYHYQDGAVTAVDPIEDGFLGFVHKGQEFS